MKDLNPNVRARLQEITGSFKDSHGAMEQELRLYVWFHVYLFDEIITIGGEETGYVFRQKGEQTLLVYKATFDDVRRVVFVTGASPVECMRSMCRQFYGGTLKWVNDKYG